MTGVAMIKSGMGMPESLLIWPLSLLQPSWRRSPDPGRCAGGVILATALCVNLTGFVQVQRAHATIHDAPAAA